MVCLAPHFGVRREVFRLLTRYFNYNLVNMGGIFIYPCPIPCIKVTQMELYKQLANFFTGVRLKKRAALKVLNGEQYDTTGLI